jgi:long-chain acyl-CoA synthetase
MTYRNLVEMHRRQAERLGPLPALSFKRYGLYHDITWDQYRADALAGAAALVDAGVRPGDRVGLVAENSVEWLIADMAILTAGAVNVPPHAPLAAKQVHYQLEHAEAIWLIVSNRDQLDKVRQFRGELPLVRGVVVFESNASGDDAQAWAGFLQRGRAALPRLAAELARREAALDGDALATIMYTSGTTGVPKGVMLTHDNLVSNTLASLSVSGHRPDDVRLSWLPYSHIYARTIDHYGSIGAGIPLALADSVDTLVLNLAEVRPTHMASVPRFYEKVLTAVASPDPAVTARRLRDVFGPRIDWISSGGAPLPVPIAQEFHKAGVLVLQGYGLTETSPVISFNSKENYKIETVGRALPGVEVKIADDGEILTRGPHVMKGYWREPQATADTIRDGWLHTGDLGELDADGYLKITGRKKELMVLSNGKKVVPSYLEGLIMSDPCIDQAVVVGEARNFLTALIVPAWDNVAKALNANGAALLADEESRAKQPAVVALLQRRVEAALAEVSKMEQVKKIIVLPRPFSVAADEMTVSLKLRRGVVLKKYAPQLEELYRGDPGSCGTVS